MHILLLSGIMFSVPKITLFSFSSSFHDIFPMSTFIKLHKTMLYVCLPPSSLIRSMSFMYNQQFLTSSSIPFSPTPLQIQANTDFKGTTHTYNYEEVATDQTRNDEWPTSGLLLKSLRKQRSETMLLDCPITSSCQSTVHQNHVWMSFISSENKRNQLLALVANPVQSSGDKHMCFPLTTS